MSHVRSARTQSQPDAVTVTAAAVDVTSTTIDAQLLAPILKDKPTIDDQMSAAEDKVRGVMFKLDGASKTEAIGGNWGNLSWIERYRRLQELGHIPRDLDPKDLAWKIGGQIHLPKFGTESSGKEESDWVQDTRYNFELKHDALRLTFDPNYDSSLPQGWPSSIKFPLNHMKSVRRAPGVNFDHWGIVITMLKGDLPVMRATGEAQMFDLLSALKACGLEEIVVDTPKEVDVTSTSIDAQLSAAGRTKINEKHTESDSSHVHVQVELGPPAASADGSGGFGWASGDTTEAESSAKRQAAIRAMLG